MSSTTMVSQDSRHYPGHLFHHCCVVRMHVFQPKASSVALCRLHTTSGKELQLFLHRGQLMWWLGIFCHIYMYEPIVKFCIHWLWGNLDLSLFVKSYASLGSEGNWFGHSHDTCLQLLIWTQIKTVVSCFADGLLFYNLFPEYLRLFYGLQDPCIQLLLLSFTPSDRCI